MAINSPYSKISDFGQLIIQLMDDHNVPVCYFKDHIENYKSPNPEYKWVSLKPDMSVG